MPDVSAIDLHQSRARIVKTSDQADEGRLSRPRRSDECRHLSGLDLEAQIFQNQLVRRIAKADLLEFDFPSEAPSRPCAWQVLHIAVGIQNFAYSLVSHRRLRISVGHF